MPSSTEKKTLEDYMVKKLQEKGRTYVPGDELIRENLKEPLLKKKSIWRNKRNGYVKDKGITVKGKNMLGKK